ncbi:MAG: BufA1 family periplasmic bufferin-type metallophore [Acidiferrobacter sp.]
MKNNHTESRKARLQQAAMAGMIVMAGVGFVGSASAGMLPQGWVKCYGIARAHQNQCMSVGGITRGSSTTNGNPDAWLGAPKGVCLKIVNSSLTPGK